MPIDYYASGVTAIEEGPSVGAAATISHSAHKVKGEVEKTGVILTEINSKIMGSDVRQAFKDMWGNLYSKWLAFTKESPLLKGILLDFSRGHLTSTLDTSRDYRQKAILFYEAWKKEMIRTPSEQVSNRPSTDDQKTKTKWALGILAVAGAFWGGKKLLDLHRDRKRDEREVKRMERLESLGLLGEEPTFLPPVAPPPPPPVTIVNNLASPFPAHHRSDPGYTFKPTPPPLFPREKHHEEGFEELPDPFSHPEPAGY